MSSFARLFDVSDHSIINSFDLEKISWHHFAIFILFVIKVSNGKNKISPCIKYSMTDVSDKVLTCPMPFLS